MPFVNEEYTHKGEWFANSNFVVGDVTRPLRYAIDDYGWVNLAGWLRYIGGTFNANDSTTYGVNDGTTLFPAEIQTNGFRDMVGMTSFGPVHYTVSGGLFYFRPQLQTSVALIQNSSWLSFDGVSYRL